MLRRMRSRSNISFRRHACAALAALVLAGCASRAETSQGSQAVASQRALEYLPDAETLDWTDPETGLAARVTVISTARDADGRFCRRLAYQPDLAADGVIRSYCRDAETGLWEPAD